MRNETKDSHAEDNQLQNSIVDAVFVIGTGSHNNNAELKYALRNLEKNCPFVRDVYISGECPSWVNTSVVRHLKWPDRFKHAKDANIIDKLRHACEQPGISKNILFCSDDQFQTRVCMWDDFKPRWLRHYSKDDPWYVNKHRVWHDRLRKTLERDRKRREQDGIDQSTIYYYQPHMWMQIDRDKFIEYAKWCDYEHRDDTIIASGYFNFVNAESIQNTDHVFIAPTQTWPVKATHIAYTDSSFQAAMNYLRKSFKTRSRFEVGIPGEDTSLDDISDRMQRFKDIVASDPIWSNVSDEISRIEKLKAENVPGWKEIWNEVIIRWVKSTENGNKHDNVPACSIKEITDLLDAYAEHAPEDKLKELAKALPIQTASEVRDVPVPHKDCPKCEERRRKAAARAAERLAETREIVEAELSKPVVNHSKDALTADDACEDCAKTHIATAVAYMNSNIYNPTALEIELAKGELTVAGQHLLALERKKSYTRCSEILASAAYPTSMLSVKNLRELLQMVLNGE